MTGLSNTGILVSSTGPSRISDDGSTTFFCCASSTSKNSIPWEPKGGDEKRKAVEGKRIFTTLLCTHDKVGCMFLARFTFYTLSSLLYICCTIGLRSSSTECICFEVVELPDIIWLCEQLTNIYQHVHATEY